jgi:hypothetical protein
MLPKRGWRPDAPGLAIPATRLRRGGIESGPGGEMNLGISCAKGRDDIQICVPGPAREFMGLTNSAKICGPADIAGPFVRLLKIKQGHRVLQDNLFAHVARHAFRLTNRRGDVKGQGIEKRAKKTSSDPHFGPRQIVRDMANLFPLC